MKIMTFLPAVSAEVDPDVRTLVKCHNRHDRETSKNAPCLCRGRSVRFAVPPHFITVSRQRPLRVRHPSADNHTPCAVSGAPVAAYRLHSRSVMILSECLIVIAVQFSVRSSGMYSHCSNCAPLTDRLLSYQYPVCYLFPSQP